MNQAIDSNQYSYFLEPGYVYFTRAPAVICTVVGSCVTVCLWDRVRGYGGMNHFLKPLIRDKHKATPVYGNVATTALINAMEDAGCKAHDLIAQILGGGFPDEGVTGHVGQQNVDVAREVLARRGVKVASEDVGGAMGRKVVFDTEKGNLVIFKVHQLRRSDWGGVMRRRTFDTQARVSAV